MNKKGIDQTKLTNIWHPIEPRHDKTNKVTMRPAKTQISLGIRPVWSESSLCAQWVAKDPSFLHADSEDSDQTGLMPRLIWVIAGRTHILLVLSCRGSISVPLSSSCHQIKERQHDKTNNVAVHPAKTQISLGIRPVWSESSLFAWRELVSLATHWAHSEDSDQTGWKPRLIWVFAGCTVTLLVLSCCGSKF